MEAGDRHTLKRTDSPQSDRWSGWSEAVEREAPVPAPEAFPQPDSRPVAPMALDPEAADDPWRTAFGLETGSEVLPDGRVREIDVDGERLEILELDGQGLTAIQHGRIDDVSVSMETARHDADGRPLTRLTSELHAVEGFSPAMSAAALHRDGQWFEDGLAVRDVREGMRVFVVRAAGLDAAVEAGPPLGDSLHARHCASIREFRGEDQILAATVDQAWDLTLDTNADAVAPAAGHRFTLTITTRDAVGRPVRGLRLTDGREADGKRLLGLSLTRYVSGQVAGVLEGNWTAPETAPPSPVEAAWRQVLPGGAPLDAALTDAPDAGAILSGMFLDAAREMGAFLDPARQALAARARELAGLAGPEPHAVTWTRENYEAGVLVCRRTDTGHVRTAGPEEDGPALLAGASHTDERFWDGAPVSRHRLELEELAGDDGPVTSCRAVAGVGDQPRLATRVTPGPLTEADPEAGRAGAAMVRETGAALAEVLALLARLH